MILSEILQAKGRRIYTIVAHASLADVVDRLVEYNVGSIVVCDGDGRLAGIVTERDILRACAARRGLEDNIVEKNMTTDVITASPRDNVETVMGLMTEHRIRHLPILEDDRLVGIISIGDIVKAQHEELTRENHYLMCYIQS